MERARLVGRRPWQGARVLVTGGGGFIGSHVVEALGREGAHVTALARTRGRLSDLPAPCAYEFVSCDLRDSEAALEAVVLSAPEIIYHFASLPDRAETHEQAASSIQASTLGTLNLLEGARHAGTSLLVFGDSSKVYGNAGVPYRETSRVTPLSSYAVAKAAAWDLCQLYSRLHGLSAVSVRPTLVFGPRQRYNLVTFVAERASSGQEVRLDGGDQTRDPLFVRDAVEAFLAVGLSGCALDRRIVNIGGGCERTVRDIAALIVEVLGSRSEVVACPARRRPTEMPRSFCDNADAARMIAWHPRTSLRDGLRATLIGDTPMPALSEPLEQPHIS